MNYFQYPSSVLNQPNVLKNALGSFWDTLYGDQDSVIAYVTAKSEVELQTLNDLNEAANSAGLSSCPVYHTVRWYPYTILASQRMVGTLLTYGSGAVYGVQPNTGVIYSYGGAVDQSASYSISPSISKLPVLSSHVNDPSAVLINEVDYHFDAINHRVSFLVDPFSNPRIPAVPVYGSNGIQTDSSITLWGFYAAEDYSYLSTLFGYVFNLTLSSSPAYKRLLLALQDSCVLGTSLLSIIHALSAYTDAPVALSDGEVVSVIENDSSGLAVITDKHVYRYSAQANPVVTVGTILSAGQTLTDVFTIYSPGSGQVPPLSSLQLGPGMLDPSIIGPITFLNQNLATTVTTAADGHTVITFPVTGAASDVAQFWKVMDAKGVAKGVTLANLLDQRPVKTGQPSAANLPTTINPMAFVFQNVLRNHALVVTVRPTAFGPGALSSDNGVLRKLMPPGQTLVPVNLV